MQLATDPIVIRLPAETITLSVTLRAALRLERLYDGFDKILRGVIEGDLGIMSDVIREGADQTSTLPNILEELFSGPLFRLIDAIRQPCLRYVQALCGINLSAKADPVSSNAPKISFRDHHTRLFRIATGALGWSPEQAWKASPAEIVEAYQGRIEFVGAIFGSKSKDQSIEKPDDAQKRALNAIGDMNNLIMPKVS